MFFITKALAFSCPLHPFSPRSAQSSLDPPDIDVLRVQFCFFVKCLMNGSESVFWQVQLRSAVCPSGCLTAGAQDAGCEAGFLSPQDTGALVGGGGALILWAPDSQPGRGPPGRTKLETPPERRERRREWGAGCGSWLAAGVGEVGCMDPPTSNPLSQIWASRTSRCSPGAHRSRHFRSLGPPRSQVRGLTPFLSPHR